MITIILINVLGNLPFAIFCDDQGNEEKCFQAFQRFCPHHFLVEEVKFMKFPVAPVCRVRVSYKAENDDLPGEGEALKTLIQLILDESPHNCYIYDRGLIEKDKVVLDYGLLKCKCEPPVFEMADVKHLHIC